MQKKTVKLNLLLDKQLVDQLKQIAKVQGKRWYAFMTQYLNNLVKNSLAK